MPGKTAKVTITERQHDLLETIHKAPTASSQLRQRAAIILGPSRSGTTRRSPPQSGCRGGRSAPGDDVGPMPGSGSSASSAPRPTPRCAGPSSRSSAMSPAPAPPASSLPSRSWRSWHWPASPRRSPAGRSLTGRPRNWPTRPSSAASCPRSRSLKWVAISASRLAAAQEAVLAQHPRERSGASLRGGSRRSATPTRRRRPGEGPGDAHRQYRRDDRVAGVGAECPRSSR